MVQNINQSSSLLEIYKSFYKYNPNVIFALNTNGKFVLVNEMAIHLTGYTREELLQLSLTSIVHEKYSDTVTETFIELLGGKKKSFEVSIYHKSGALIDLSITTVPIFIGQQIIGIAGMTKDLTERNTIQRELDLSKNQLENLFNNLDICVVTTDVNRGYILDISPGCYKLYGRMPEDLLQQPSFFWKEAVHPDDIDIVRTGLINIHNGKRAEMEYRIKDVKGTVKWVKEQTTPIFDESGILTKFESVITDISDRRKVEEDLKFLANHDLLTELPNRSMFEKMVQSAVDDAYSKKSKLAVFYLDLDHFKLINDTLGHHAGDELLQIIAARLRKCLRSTDIISRQGGDEFAILLDGFTDVKQLDIVAKRLIETVTDPLRLADREYVITTSLGISIYPDDTEDPHSLIKQADQAMYHAKENGNSSYQYYQSSMSINLSRRLELEQDLRQALKENELTIYYQPVVDIRSKRIIGFEALLRWIHPKHGFISPAEFIPIAEESGLIIPIGEWVLRTACMQFKELHKGGHPDTYVSVNVSTKQFEGGNFVSFVEKVLEETNFNPTLLKVEITESVMMKDIEDIVVKLKVLEELGVKVFLDDFGKGYSSLYYLQRLPINLMKIDKSYVQSIDNNSGQETIIRTIIAMANSLGLGIIAEGVELESQISFLEDHGCYNLQGFIFSKPVPYDLIPGLLEKSTLEQYTT
ncbi:hypothetical protein AM500_22805 [Bacillus sp. FJAT-18017]|uniref:sensor domain-containing protein n=1 Tax=Bacillus sp. FJAT-18017 TaxID=1705566 RepID=UPI0006AE14CB|nr:bifunctional diguanylate cyclase/phosphodiesterase [Bacillus sp. FJAT-18017]ALC92283.1 hypothetical protein AM500_22805 [Bacillus sp. FJAT-18017]